MQSQQRTGCKPQIIIVIISLIILVPAAIIGGNALARNNPVALGFLLGLAAGLSLLIAAAFGSLYGAWLMRTGAGIARDVVESRSASEKAMSAVMKGAFQAMGDRGQLPPPTQWGHYEQFPMNEPAQLTAPDDEGYVA